MKYVISRVILNEEFAVRFWKTQYKTYDKFYEEVVATKLLHPDVVQFAETVKDAWDNFNEFAREDVLMETDYSKLRLLKSVFDPK